MPLSSFDIPPPRINDLLPPDAELRNVLLPIWLAAQRDPNAFSVLKASLYNGQLDGIYQHAQLAHHIRKLQPVNAKKTTSYVVYPTVWMLASTAPFLSATVFSAMASLSGMLLRPLFADVHERLLHVLDAVHFGLLEPIDPYTLEILREFWDVACAHPSALQEHVPGSLAIAEHIAYTDPRIEHHRSLAWSIWKLRTNGMHRLSCPGACPIAELPFELLSEVFSQVRGALPYYEDRGGRDHWNKSSHLGLRLVCRRWRAVVDCTPALWAQLILDFGTQMTKRALRLSKGELLDVMVNDERPWNDSHLLVFEHLSRVRTITMMSQSWNAFEHLPALLRMSAAPHLSSIHLFPFLDLEGQLTIVLPTDIFQATPPRDLRIVNVLDCTIHLPSPLFPPTLVCLRLSRCDVWANLDSLLDTLSSLPVLEVFEWNMGLNTISNANSAARLPETMYHNPTREPVLLPYLQLLEIECPTACAAPLVARLILPPSCRIDLTDDYTLTGMQGHDHDVRLDLVGSLVASLGSHISRIFPAHSNTGYDTILVEEHQEAAAGGGALYVQGRTSGGVHPRCSVGLFIADEQQGRIDDDTSTFLLRNILSWPAMSTTVTCFETNHEIFANAALWAEVLVCLSGVSIIQLDNSGETDASGAISGLVSALRATLSAAPALSHIHLRYLSFPTVEQERLAEVAADRLTAGHPALALSVDECTDLNYDDLRGVLLSRGRGGIYLDESPGCCQATVLG